MRTQTQPAADERHHATFRSRGVAAAFTTPMLAGARVRQSGHAGIELVVSNPSGGRGLYILDWPGVQALCTPTMHDTVLFRQLSELQVIDPASVRSAALVVATCGFAGRAAAAAAGSAIAQDLAERSLTHRRLLRLLLEQQEPNAPTPADLVVDLKVSLHRLALSLGRPAARLATDLTALADAFAPLGIPPDLRNGRMPRMIARLEASSTELRAWLDADVGNDVGGLGRAVTEAMRLSTRSAEALLEVEHAALINPAALLRRWVLDAAVMRRSASRCDWLLDGWERICLLWAIASSDASRRATVLEMAMLVPMLPREVEQWTDVAIPWEAMNDACCVTICQDTWRRGSAALGWIERNEKLRAMSI